MTLVCRGVIYEKLGGLWREMGPSLFWICGSQSLIVLNSVLCILGQNQKDSLGDCKVLTDDWCFTFFLHFSCPCGFLVAAITCIVSTSHEGTWHVSTCVVVYVGCISCTANR